MTVFARIRMRPSFFFLDKYTLCALWFIVLFICYTIVCAFRSNTTETRVGIRLLLCMCEIGTRGPIRRGEDIFIWSSSSPATKFSRICLMDYEWVSFSHQIIMNVKKINTFRQRLFFPFFNCTRMKYAMFSQFDRHTEYKCTIYSTCESPPHVKGQ